MDALGLEVVVDHGQNEQHIGDDEGHGDGLARVAHPDREPVRSGAGQGEQRSQHQALVPIAAPPVPQGHCDEHARRGHRDERQGHERQGRGRARRRMAQPAGRDGGRETQGQHDAEEDCAQNPQLTVRSPALGGDQRRLSDHQAQPGREDDAVGDGERRKRRRRMDQGLQVERRREAGDDDERCYAGHREIEASPSVPSFCWRGNRRARRQGGFGRRCHIRHLRILPITAIHHRIHLAVRKRRVRWRGRLDGGAPC